MSSGVIAKQRRPRVLVVDDEPILRRVIERGLRDRFDLVVAADGQQAVDAIDRGAEFDIVLTDIRMPRLDGFGLHDAILRRDPKLAARTIFMSASTGEPAVTERVASLGGRLITKPFSILELGEILVGYLTDLVEPCAVVGAAVVGAAVVETDEALADVALADKLAAG